MRHVFRLLPLFLPTLALALASPPPEPAAVRTLLRERKLAAAEAAAREFLALHPRAAEAHALLGEVRLAQDDGAGAIQAFEQAASLAPTDSEIHLGLAKAYETALDQSGILAKLSLARKCLAALEKSVALDPANVAARMGLMGYHAGAPALFGGRRDKAWGHAVEIRKLDSRQGHLAYGMLYVSEKKYAPALDEFEALLRLDADHYLAHYQIGRIAALTGKDVDRGLAAMRRAVTLPATDDAPGHDAAYWRLGMLLELKGDSAAAAESYRAALALNPNSKNAAAALARLDRP